MSAPPVPRSSRSITASIASICLMIIGTFGSVACSRTRPMQDDQGRPIDTALVAYLSEARALHHKANLAEDGRDLAGAVAALEALANAPHPTSPEVDEVLADTDARLAELELERGGPEATARAGADVSRAARRPGDAFGAGQAGLSAVGRPAQRLCFTDGTQTVRL